VGQDPPTGNKFDPHVQRNRPGLLLLNGIVYVGFGAFDCDQGNFHGWVFGYHAGTLEPAAIFCTTQSPPKIYGGGVWQSGNGLVGADDGSVYFETGNEFGQGNPPDNFGDCFVRLSVIPKWPGLVQSGCFRPANWQVLRDGDTDLGSGGPVLLPGGLLIGGGKQGRYYVLDAATMQLTQDSTSPDLTGVGEGFQAFLNEDRDVAADAADNYAKYAKGQAFGPNIHGGPCYWHGPSLLYQMPEKDYLKAFHYDRLKGPKGTVLQSPVAKTTKIRPGRGMPGGHSSLSANGDTDGIVWTIVPIQDATADPRATGILHAFHGLTLKELWKDPQAELFAKFNPPTIADGKVFRPVFAQYDWPDPPVFDHATQQIAAVSRGPGNLDLFVIGFDGRVWTTFWPDKEKDQVGWNRGDWFPLPGRARFDHTTQQIAAVSRGPGNLDLFMIHSDGRVWTTFWNEQAGWDRDPGPDGGVNPEGHFFPLPGRARFDHTTQQIAAVSRGPGNLDLFMIHSDGRVWTTFWNEQAGWDRDPGPDGGVNPEGHFLPVAPPKGPAPLYRGPGKIIVYGWIPARVGTPERTPRLTIRELIEYLGHRGVLARPLGEEIELADERGGRRRDFMGTVTSPRRVSVRRVAELSAPTFHHSSRNRVDVTASVFWSNETGAHIVMGEIREAYLRHGGPTGQLGYPIASETDTDDFRGRVSRFEHGEIVWDAKTGTEVRPRDRPTGLP
jgi:hypothetical protein